MVTKPFQVFEYLQTSRSTVPVEKRQPALMSRAMRRAYESQQRSVRGEPKRDS